MNDQKMKNKYFKSKIIKFQIKISDSIRSFKKTLRIKRFNFKISQSNEKRIVK